MTTSVIVTAAVHVEDVVELVVVVVDDDDDDDDDNDAMLDGSTVVTSDRVLSDTPKVTCRQYNDPAANKIQSIT